MTTAMKGDFVELEFTGRSNGKVFDSNIPEDLKQIDAKATPRKTYVIVGQGMVVTGLDKALEGKELHKQYTVDVPHKEGFGARNVSLVRTIPLRIFTEQKVYPQVGMSFILDNTVVQIRAVSGARVIADFNNPLAGKDLHYSFKIIRKIDTVEEKARIFFEWFLRGVPEFEVTDTVAVKGPKQVEPFIMMFKEKFLSLVGKELSFTVVEKKVQSEDKEQPSTQQSL